MVFGATGVVCDAVDGDVGGSDLTVGLPWSGFEVGSGRILIKLDCGLTGPPDSTLSSELSSSESSKWAGRGTSGRM